MKKTILAACFIALFLPLAVHAYSIKKGDSVNLSKNEVVEGNLYAAGSNLTIDGRVTGDVICAGQSINISGEVDGDVICAGQSINISGKVGGNLRLAGNVINFNGQLARNAMIFGAVVTTSASSTIGWDLLTFANALDLKGNLGRDLYGGTGRASLDGKIGKNVNLHFGSKDGDASPLVIAGTAKIAGDVKYTSLKNAVIENGATVKGQLIHNLPIITADRPDFTNLVWWWGNLIAVFSALVIGLVIVSFWREQIIKTTDLMLNKVGASLGWGVLVLLLTPPIAIILLITIIGIPLSLILLAFWLIALYTGKILVGILVGRSLLNSFLAKRKDSLILAMIIGIVIVYLIFALPFIGRIAVLFAVLWGLGGIMLALKNK